MEVEHSASRASFSIPSLIAIGCAIASFTTGAFWGFVLAVIAVLFGVLGFIMSLSSKRRGGVVSTLAVIGGVLGVVAAIVKGLAWLL